MQASLAPNAPWIEVQRNKLISQAYAGAKQRDRKALPTNVGTAPRARHSGASSRMTEMGPEANGWLLGSVCQKRTFGIGASIVAI